MKKIEYQRKDNPKEMRDERREQFWQKIEKTIKENVFKITTIFFEIKIERMKCLRGECVQDKGKNKAGVT